MIVVESVGHWLIHFGHFQANNTKTFLNSLENESNVGNSFRFHQDERSGKSNKVGLKVNLYQRLKKLIQLKLPLSFWFQILTGAAVSILSERHGARINVQNIPNVQSWQCNSIHFHALQESTPINHISLERNTGKTY